MVFADITIEIAVFSAILVVVSRLIQIRFGNRKETAKLQLEIKEKQNRIKELFSKEDEKSKKEAQQLQTEMLENLNKMMSGNMKVMLINMIIFLPALGILSALYSGKIAHLPVPIVVLHHAPELPWFSWEISANSNWFSWYLWLSIIFGIAVTLILKKMKVE